jgi:putative transposase
MSFWECGQKVELEIEEHIEMHKLKTIQKTLDLLKQYDYQIAKVARKTGINQRTIKSWFDKQRKGQPLLIDNKKKPSKFTYSMKKVVVDYYFKHGQSASKAAKHFGYPARTTLIEWIKRDRRFDSLKPKRIRKIPVTIDDEKKINVVIELATTKLPIKELAKKYNTTREGIYTWQKELTGESMKRTNIETKDVKTLQNEIEHLRIEHDRLDMENKILKKANELLKKDMGTDYARLSNKDKAKVVSALSNQYSIIKLISVLNIAKTTYYYCLKALRHDKYHIERCELRKIFYDNYSTFGYRRMKQSLLQETGISISEKVVMRLMKEENLVVFTPKSKKFNSYKGELTPSVPNILNRDFRAIKPYEKAVTDITEFGLSDGKVYLSPLIDCFTGSPITWRIGKAPTSELTNSMLSETYQKIGSRQMIVHSDRGFHYRLGSWINKMNEYGYVRSMSKKGCSPDNAACEGFFGTLKKEFFYPRDWKLVSVDEFTIELDRYLKWFVERRIKKNLNYLSPKEFMINYSQTVQ